jgi:4-hydroxy-tetrahydrodipicolinate synthase
VRDAVIEMTQSRIPVVLGIGGNETRDIVDIMKRTDSSRIQGVLSVTPYYNNLPRPAWWPTTKPLPSSARLQ